MKIDEVFNYLGLVFGIANIQELLGVLLLVINILSLLIRYGLNIYNHIKEKEYKKLEEDFNGLKEELEKIDKDVKDND